MASLAMPNLASAAGELWPSVSAVLQSSWRAPTRPSPPTSSQRPQLERSSIIPNRIQAGVRNVHTLPRSHLALADRSPAQASLPECLTTAPISALGLRVAPDALRVAPTTSSIFGLISRNALSRCNPVPRSLPLHRLSRQFSTTTQFGPFTLRKMPSIGNVGLMQRRTMFGSNTSYNLLSHMEQTANNNPSSATAQNAFYSALLRANRPDLVVQRYETGRFASNPACEATYHRSLEKIGQSDGQLQHNTNLNGDQLNAVAQAVGARVRGGNVATARSGSGIKDSPLYVVVEESLGSSIFKYVKFFLWFGFAAWIFYVLVTMLVEAGGMLKKVGGQTHAEAKPELQKTKFSDVQGCDEAKEDLQELVEFLKDPTRFATLGGKLPKGVLMVGPPGTGKTLLARAVAGESGVPFFYMSGSEFDEIYVGVGAKRVRELFAAARSKAPAIIFIDELDAIGGKRNERDHAYAKQTLNQLLTELDGFDQETGVIILAATNFPELLDKALTRPGRFDRNVAVSLPDVRGRMAILKAKTSKMQLGTDVDISIIARGTPGFSGAELENLANQAAVHASKRKATKIHMADYEWAKDKILMGAERRSAVIQEKDKIMTAYHEGGHALVALFNPHADPLYKVTIMPRGHALGITFSLPELDQVSKSKQSYLAGIDVAMGGKVAEEMIYGDDAVSSGASSDISAATGIAYQMVTRFGMSEKLGNVDLDPKYNLPPQTSQLIWDEVRRIVEESKERAKVLLTSRRKELETLAKALIEYETLSKDEVERVLRGEKLPNKMVSAKDAPIKVPELPLLPIGAPPEPPKGTPGPGGPPVEEPSAVPGSSEPPRPYPAGSRSL